MAESQNSSSSGNDLSAGFSKKAPDDLDKILTTSGNLNFILGIGLDDIENNKTKEIICSIRQLRTC